MVIKKLVVGPLENNCYVVADKKSKESFVVDPGDEPDRIINLINENDLVVKYIVCTHAHFDHVGAISDIKRQTDADIVIHVDEYDIYKKTKIQAISWGFDIDELPEPDRFVSEGDMVVIGDIKFEVLHTPGHSPGSICLLGERVLFSGDTIFAGSVGRTDLYGGNIERLKDSFKRIMSLSDEIRILPGHGPETYIGREKKENSFSIQ